MRLVDADAIEIKPPQGSSLEFDAGALYAIYEILKMPTIDPVKRGSWIHDDFGWHCSLCWSLAYAPNDIPPDYCSWCGAKM